MQLMIDGQMRELIEIAAFRQQNDLPPAFGVALFEPKDSEGLGRIDHAASGEALNELRTAVLSGIPDKLALNDLMDFMPRLGNLFRVKLYEVNEVVGLRPVEIDFAAAGFDDVGQALVYALVRSHAGVRSRTRGASAVSFADIYAGWLNDTVRVSQTIHAYRAPDGTLWRLRILNNAYGRVGLVAQTGDDTYYVRDVTLACPAEGFMSALLSAVAGRVIAAVASTTG